VVPGPTRHGSPRRRGFERERGLRGRKPLRRCGSDVLRRGLGSSGTTAVGPGQGRLKHLGVCGAFRPRIPQSSRLTSTVDERVQGCGNAQRPSCSKELRERNPRSGSGPSESARPEGEEPVEGVRNPGDGTCRVRQTRVMRIPPPMSLKGRETPGGATRSTQDRGGHFGPNPERATKPRELPGGLRTDWWCRATECLVVVETTRRLGRTNVVPTTRGGLREASQP
jgi:hypothetical protein